MNTPYFKDEGDFWSILLFKKDDNPVGDQFVEFNTAYHKFFFSTVDIDNYCQRRGWKEYTVE